jgi:hypothetical protein
MEEAEKQLQDKPYYRKKWKTTPSLTMNIETFLTHILSKGLIDEDSYSFMGPLSTTKTQTIYMLPKIHNEGCPGRPIISGCQSPISNLTCAEGQPSP